MLCAQSRRASELAVRRVRRGMRSLPVSFLSSSQSCPMFPRLLRAGAPVSGPRPRTRGLQSAA